LPIYTQFVTGSLTLDPSTSGTLGTGPPDLVRGLTLAANEAATVTFAVTVTSPLIDGTRIANTATLTSTEVSTPTTATVTDSVSVMPLLALRKVSAYAPPLHPGDRITYTIVARNSGNANATGGVIRDPLPAHTQFVGGSLALDPPNTDGTLGTGPPDLVRDLTLVAGEDAVTITFAVTVTSPLTDGTRIANTVTLTSTEVSTPTTATVTDIVSAMPLLALRKVSAYTPPLHPGDRITYTIVARNSGNANATGGVIRDPLPAHTQFVGGSLAMDPPDTDGTLGTGPPDLVRDLTLIAGVDVVTITFAVTVTAPLANGTHITNTATFTCTEVSTPAIATVIDTVSAVPLLKLRKASTYTSPLHPGDRITYTIVARNDGYVDATGGVIRDPLPAHTQFVTGSLTLDPSASGTLGTGPPHLVRDLTLVASGAATITFAVTVTSPLTDDTLIVNTATLTSTEVSRPLVATVADTVSATSPPIPEYIALSPQRRVIQAGERVTYTVLAVSSLGDQWDVTSEASFEIEARAGGMWMANTYMSQVPGVWTVTATLQHLSDTAILEVKASVVQTLYLPILVKQIPQAPDLSITHLIATQTHITMVIQNVGNAPVVNNFWVDAYVDPDPIPSAPNDIWQDFADQGLAWGVTEDLLPGATLVLTEGNAMPWITRTLITWPLRIGTPIYAQVDSAYVGQSYGAVLESHEILGGPYTNIAGPVNVAASAPPIYIPTLYRRTARPPFWKLEAQLPER
jgi:uncharacterized repeat protein (TIGR01451 family)